MKNVQITIDQATLAAVDKAALPLGLKRSEIVRQALRAWLRRRSVERFEQNWIAALRKHPDDAIRADDWLSAGRDRHQASGHSSPEQAHGG